MRVNYMSLFLLAFFLIYGGVHLYFFSKVKTAFALGMSAWICLALFLIVMIIAPIMVRMFEKREMEEAARFMAFAGYIWMGFLFLYFSASLAIDLYHGLLHVAGFAFRKDISSFYLSGRTAFIVPLAWGTIAAAYGYFEARNIRSERVVLTSPKIPQTLGRLTIVQISDVHLGLIVRKERLKAMLAQVTAAVPDILVATGDLVDGQIDSLTGLAELLREVRPRYGKYAITGNHELYAGLEPSLGFMRSAGFKILQGEEFTIPGLITIVGVDDPVIKRFSAAALGEEQRLMAGLPKDTYTLLLKHRPALREESIGRFDLQLSGHVHKGQLFPFNLVTYLFYPVKAGINHYPQNTLLYVSRGTGTWGPPIRFLAPPEVTIIELSHGPAN